LIKLLEIKKLNKNLNRRILIIGGNGFLGYNLSKKLVKKGFLVTSLCRKKNHSLKTIKGINYIYCDLNNLSKLKKKIKEDYDSVINFSGNIDHSNKLQTLKVHYLGLKNIYKIFEKKKLRLFIQAGSSLEYGKKKSPQKELISCKPISIYGKAKYKASKFLFNNKKKFNFIILRLYQVYGPYQKTDRLIPFIIRSCLKDKKFDCTEGIQKRDFLYIDDFINLVIKILNKKKIQTDIYNVGYGKTTSVKNIINQILKITKKGHPNFGKIKMRKDEIMNLYPNIEKVKKDFKWNPGISLVKGLKSTIRSYRD